MLAQGLEGDRRFEMPGPAAPHPSHRQAQRGCGKGLLRFLTSTASAVSLYLSRLSRQAATSSTDRREASVQLRED